MCDNSKIGSLDLVKNSFAAEPVTHRKGQIKTICIDPSGSRVVCVNVLTGDKTSEVWLDGFELVNIILSLLIRDLPRIIVATGLPLDLIGRCC